MKAVDPEIKLGVVLNEPGEFNQRAWDLPVLKVIGKRFDFLTPHQYTPVRTYDPAGYHGVFLEQRNHFRQTINTMEKMDELIRGVQEIFPDEV